MTVHEEDRPKTETTGQVLGTTDEARPGEPSGSGRTLREALEEAGVRPDDFQKSEKEK
ncbi:hypothetical protein [Streptomyces avermitilis]|uniref:Uncharacterized protein n=1 Tax=Streptomyces avermitilis TaxID=33903 RepID=A0A4D4MHY8_STRAX|nr:hypothetical protein [Streptomyces avermitilis]GDY68043.1 hypothetical protein SAV14893_074360 [Streptomyces avermitilis]GDY71620.1 hypothetical protein SAV31267_011050 [Streptomyces avermitilis]